MGWSGSLEVLTSLRWSRCLHRWYTSSHPLDGLDAYTSSDGIPPHIPRGLHIPPYLQMVPTPHHTTPHHLTSPVRIRGPHMSWSSPHPTPHEMVCVVMWRDSVLHGIPLHTIHPGDVVMRCSALHAIPSHNRYREDAHHPIVCSDEEMWRDAHHAIPRYLR